MHILIMLRCAILSVHNRKLRCTVVFHPDDQKHILRIDSHPDKALLRVSQLFHTLYCIVKRIAEYAADVHRFNKIQPCTVCNDRQRDLMLTAIQLLI